MLVIGGHRLVVYPGDFTSAGILTLSQDHQNKLGDKRNLEFGFFIQTVQNNNVYTVFVCLNNI